MCNPSADTVQQLVSGSIISPVQGSLKGDLVGGPMALEHQSAQAQERSAVVSAMVYAVFKCG
jgi:hypothetical protein